MEGGIGSVILGYIIWRLTGNLLIGAIAATVLWPLLNAILSPITRSIRMIGVKAPPFYELMELDCSDPEAKSKGVRVLLITDSEIATVPEQERLKAYEALYMDGAAKFFDKDAFRQRILAVQKDNLPLRVCASVCKVSHLPSMTKCFSVWRKIMAAESFTIGETDKDFFVEDLAYTLPGQDGERRAGIAFCFDQNISVGEAAATDEAAALPPCPAFHGGIHEIAANA